VQGVLQHKSLERHNIERIRHLPEVLREQGCVEFLPLRCATAPHSEQTIPAPMTARFLSGSFFVRVDSEPSVDAFADAAIGPMGEFQG